MSMYESISVNMNVWSGELASTRVDIPPCIPLASLVDSSANISPVDSPSVLMTTSPVTSAVASLPLPA